MRLWGISVSLLTVLLVLLYAISHAQEQQPVASTKAREQTENLKIVPLIVLKPGETKEILLSTWCTVGPTRGGGFSLAEMRNGVPVFENGTLQGGLSYSRDGVTISVPDWDEATKQAGSAQYALLKQHNINAFTLTVKASDTAKPGLMEMHLLDATCAGECKTDFRVLVVKE